ncbi:polysaccharide deacetylase family protein [Streptomyces sp. NPDC088925]|uniref:polysaccharide deacetylase family protein n=1 Tax=Streptomyces sp. NPDC088925 TaxID=3365914 RepID=UPI0038090423
MHAVRSTVAPRRETDPAPGAPSRRALLRTAGLLALTPVAACAGATGARPPEAATTPPRRLPPPRAQRARAPEEPDAKPPEPAPGPRTPPPAPPPPVRTRPFARLPRAGHALALTFDDGPDPRWTPEVLAVLAAHDVRATFFVCGRQAAKHPALLRRITEAGHLVGNHTWDHRRLTGLGRAAVEEQIARTSETVRRATGRAPAWFRAPYGEWDRTVYTLGARHGMEPLAWSVDTEDWSRPGAAAITRRVLAGARPGAVVLCHDGGGDRAQTVTALRRFLPRLRADGWDLVRPDRQLTRGAAR